MPSNIRRGHIPQPPTGVGEHVDEIYSLKGFFGEWAHIHRRRNLGFPTSWSDDALMYQGTDTNSLASNDAVDPYGGPMPLLVGDGVVVSLSRRSQPMPFAEKNVDHHQIRFYHRGDFLLETELGPLTVGPGDLAVIPRGLIYRERPLTEQTAAVFIFESAQPVLLAESLWDSVGFSSFFIDYSEMDVPAPHQPDGASIDVETEVRVKDGGRVQSMTYGFDPCRDAIGWVGDPVVYKLSIWSVPAAGTSRGFLPPPSGAILWGENYSFFLNAAATPPFPSEPAPNASYGAPSHQNDYDEVWLNHESARAPHTDGHLWLLPRTIPHPGAKFAPSYPKNPPRETREMKLNFDTRSRLELTAEARAALIDDPLLAYYTSFCGLPEAAIPESTRRLLDAARGS